MPDFDLSDAIPTAVRLRDVDWGKAIDDFLRWKGGDGHDTAEMLEYCHRYLNGNPVGGVDGEDDDDMDAFVDKWS